MKTCNNCRSFRVALDTDTGTTGDSCQKISDIKDAPESLLFIIEQMLFQAADKGECPMWQRVTGRAA